MCSLLLQFDPWILVLRDLQDNGTRSLPGQRPILHRAHPPPAKSQTDEPLQKAADMFRAPAQAASSNQPTAPGSASAADFEKTMAPKTPPKNPGPKGPPRSVSAVPASSLDDEQMFQATHRSSYEQLLEQIARRAQGRNAVDYYEEGLTPLLAYMFFVLRYHENY